MSVDRTDPSFELEKVIDTMRVEHLQCRDFAHSWRPFTVRRTSVGTYEQVLRCSRCRTLRQRELNAHGAIIGNTRYDYADGYVVKGLGRIVGEEKDHLRLAVIKQTIVEDTAEED